MISVVIPCWNHARYLPDAVGSVCANEGVEYECIVVNDASPDDTHEVAMELALKYAPVVYVNLEENRGLSGARNAGIAEAQGKYIVCLDADDKMSPRYLEAAHRFLDDGCADVAAVDAIYFGQYAGIAPVPDEIVLSIQLYTNTMNYASAYRREMWKALGGYDEQMRDGYEDWEFWIRVLKAGYSIKKLYGKYFFYRRQVGSMIDDADAKREEILDYMRSKHPELVAQ